MIPQSKERSDPIKLSEEMKEHSEFELQTNLIYWSKRVVVANMDLQFSLKKLLETLQELSGQHWSRWKL